MGILLPTRCKSQTVHAIFSHGTFTGAKNKVRIEMTLASWYGEKLKELRVDTGFESIKHLQLGFCVTLCRFCAVGAANNQKA